MSGKHRYSAFGLTIESELALPELPSCDTTAAFTADVLITFGKTPVHLPNPSQPTPWLETSPGRFLLTVDAAGKYYVENGNRILLEPFDGSDDDDIRTFLYNSVFAAVLQQRGLLALHGSAVVIGGKATILLGAGTVGKSAIAMALYDRGYSVLTDEVCAVGLLDGQAVVYPGIPRLELWENTLNNAGKDCAALHPIRRGLHKYVLPVADRFASAPVPLSRIIPLAHHNLPEFMVEPLKGGMRLEKILQQQLFMSATPDSTTQFGLSVRTACADTLCISYHYSRSEFYKVVDIIEKEMGA